MNKLILILLLFVSGILLGQNGNTIKRSADVEGSETILRWKTKAALDAYVPTGRKQYRVGIVGDSIYNFDAVNKKWMLVYPIIVMDTSSINTSFIKTYRTFFVGEMVSPGKWGQIRFDNRDYVNEMATTGTGTHSYYIGAYPNKGLGLTTEPNTASGILNTDIYIRPADVFVAFFRHDRIDFLKQVTMSSFLELKPSTAPTTPSEGTIYYDGTAHELKYWNGTLWKAF